MVLVLVPNSKLSNFQTRKISLLFGASPIGVGFLYFFYCVIFAMKLRSMMIDCIHPFTFSILQQFFTTILLLRFFIGCCFQSRLL